MATDPINNSGAISSLLRAQSVGIIALNSNKQATQALITQLAKGVKPVAVSTNAGNNAGGNLPRGSLVDILA
jgi:hypothetical protein